LLVAVAGPAVFSYMMFFQRDYVGQFFELPGGTMLLSTACVLQLVGLIWVGGLLRNKY
jgi:Flp pilus assembly protein TadB